MLDAIDRAREVLRETHLWIFAYGSLLWRPGFAFARRARAFAHGYERRFHQGSPDHRGTPERPGRVVTLERREGACSGGVAYAIAEDGADEILAMLDHRERGGYERAIVDVVIDEGRGEIAVQAITWIAGPRNPHRLGPAPLEAIAADVRASVGPSGANVDYVLRLADTLRELGIDDAHVFALEAAVKTCSSSHPNDAL